MGKWLAAYRERYGKEEAGLAPLPAQAQEGRSVEWRSKRFGTCRGRIRMVSEDGWVLIEGALVPKMLIWVREELLGV